MTKDKSNSGRIKRVGSNACHSEATSSKDEILLELEPNSNFMFCFIVIFSSFFILNKYVDASWIMHHIMNGGAHHIMNGGVHHIMNGGENGMIKEKKKKKKGGVLMMI